MNPITYVGGLPSVTVTFHSSGRSVRFVRDSVHDLLDGEAEELAANPEFRGAAPTNPENPTEESTP